MRGKLGVKGALAILAALLVAAAFAAPASAEFGFESFDVADCSLGLFPTAKAAADAISALGTPDAVGPHALTDRRRRHG